MLKCSCRILHDQAGIKSHFEPYRTFERIIGMPERIAAMTAVGWVARIVDWDLEVTWRHAADDGSRHDRAFEVSSRMTATVHGTTKTREFLNGRLPAEA